MSKRLKQHRETNSFLKGNDLRYNLYISKMQKLCRKDLGLDVEGYKNYLNNIKMFAKCNYDF